jgi:hypothetical protein
MMSPTQPTSSGGKEERTTKTNVKRRSGDVDSLDAQGVVSKRDSLADKKKQERKELAMTGREADRYYTNAVYALAILSGIHLPGEFDLLLRSEDRGRIKEQSANKIHTLVNDLKKRKANFRHLANAYNNEDHATDDFIRGNVKNTVDWRTDWKNINSNKNISLSHTLYSQLVCTEASQFPNHLGKGLLFIMTGLIEEAGESVFRNDYSDWYTNFHRLIWRARSSREFTLISPVEVIRWAIEIGKANPNLPMLAIENISEDEPASIFRGGGSLHLVIDEYNGNERKELIELLLKHGTDPTLVAINYGKAITPLDMMRKEAAKEDHVSCADSLSIRLLEDATIAHYLNTIQE